MCLAIPGKVLSIEDGGTLAREGQVDFAGVVKKVNLSFVPEAKVGDYVLVHVGVAIATIDESEANEVFAYLSQVGEAAEGHSA